MLSCFSVGVPSLHLDSIDEIIIELRIVRINLLPTHPFPRIRLPARLLAQQRLHPNILQCHIIGISVVDLAPGQLILPHFHIDMFIDKSDDKVLLELQVLFRKQLYRRRIHQIQLFVILVISLLEVGLDSSRQEDFISL